MPGTREIKRRIRSVSSTKKITRAMQMISAVKMRKAQTAAMNSRTYSEMAWEIVSKLRDKVDPKYHALLQKREGQGKTAVIFVSSNKGLIGGFNANLLSAVGQIVKENSDNPPDFIVLGKKGRDAVLRLKYNLVAEFPKYDRTARPDEVMPLAKMVVEDYLQGKYNRILIVYTNFVSTISQKAYTKQLLPLEEPQPSAESAKENYEYLFEPDPKAVLDYLLPRILEAQVYQAILESDASEHSARMIMMKNATDAASDLIDDLTLSYNRMRQANITKELAEITAGKIAIE